MANQSSPVMVKQLDTQVTMILRGIELYKLEEKAAKAIASLRQVLEDARIYARDYELSEMREEQMNNAKKAKKFLEQARQHVLKASEFNVFGPIDVAHMSAQIDLIIDELK
jgi:hypothetical protein